MCSIPVAIPTGGVLRRVSNDVLAYENSEAHGVCVAAQLFQQAAAGAELFERGWAVAVRGGSNFGNLAGGHHVTRSRSCSTTFLVVSARKVAPRASLSSSSFLACLGSRK